MFTLIQKSLKKQIIFALFVPLFLIILFIISRYYYVVHSELHKSIELQAVQLVDRTSVSLKDDIRFSKYFELSETVLSLYNSSIKYDNKEVFKILEVALLDLENNIMAHSNPMENPLLTPYSDTKKIRNGYENSIGSIQFSWIEENRILVLKNEILLGDKTIGYLYVVVEAKSLTDAQNQILLEVLFLMIMIVVGLILFLLSFSRWVEKPVQSINNELKKLGQGDISFGLLSQRKDEFKQITESIVLADQRIYKQQHELRIEKEFNERILNAQTNFTLVTDGKDLKKTNSAMLEFFGYETLEDFHKEHDCVCDFFMEESGYLTKEVNGKTWLEEIRENLERIYYVKMKNLQGDSRVFQIVTVDEKIKDMNENIIVITFTDITAQKDFQKQLQEKVDTQLEQLRKNDIVILEQSKLASMGEMIGNISHQWRQPLSIISSGATGMLLQKQLDILSDEEFEEICNSINDNAQYLSKTIDDFRNFIKEDRKHSKFNLKENIESFLSLVEASLKKHNIKLILNLDETIEMIGYPNELIQCYMNIINNATDALELSSEDNRYFIIEAQKSDTQILLSFKDNGGGIPKDVLPRIFEPYYTTKHKSQGTGLGLHMTYKLITEGMQGSIVAQNVDFKIEDHLYYGAEFTITLPQEY